MCLHRAKLTVIISLLTRSAMSLPCISSPVHSQEDPSFDIICKIAPLQSCCILHKNGNVYLIWARWSANMDSSVVPAYKKQRLEAGAFQFTETAIGGTFWHAAAVF